MPKAGRFTGPTSTSAADRDAHRVVAAAEARRAQDRAAEIGAARYAMAREDVDRHHRDVTWVLDRAIRYAADGDREMSDWTIRHAVHVGISPVELAAGFAAIGALRDPSS